MRFSIRIHYSGQPPVIKIVLPPVPRSFRNLNNIREAAMAEKVTIGLKKEHPAGSPAEKDKRPDIELTEEDLKQIAGGTTKAYQPRPE
jgi:hypothetical protein